MYEDFKLITEKLKFNIGDKVVIKDFTTLIEYKEINASKGKSIWGNIKEYFLKTGIIVDITIYTKSDLIYKVEFETLPTLEFWDYELKSVEI